MSAGLGGESRRADEAPRLHEGDPVSDYDLYRLLSDNPHDVVYRTDAQRRAVWISRNLTDLSGWTQEDLLGTVIESLVHPDDWEATNSTRDALRSGEAIADAAEGREPPMRIRMADGSYRWMSVIGVPYIDASGEPAGIIGRLRDVDDMVRAREAAEAQQRNLQATISALLDPLLVLRPVRDETGALVDLEIVDANPAACAYAELPRERVVGTTMVALIPEMADRQRLAGFEYVLATGETLVLDEVPFPMALKGGEVRYFDVRVASSGGQIVYIVRDQTERLQAEHALEEREELYRLVTDDVTDAVVRYADDFTVTWVSPSFERLTGYRADELIGRDSIDLVATEDRADSIQLRVERLESDTRTHGRHLRLIRADGASRWVSADSRPFIRQDGSRDGFVTVLRDIDDQVQAEQRADHQIGHDRLTGLANRELAIARIDRALDDLGASGRSVGLLCIGVDRLTTVNQALSYAAGDIVLTSVATRLTEAIGDPDRVARVAGDEFLVLLPDLRSAADAASVAARLVAAGRGTLVIDGQSIEPTVSVGIANGGRSSTSEELLRQASLASRQAKDAGRDRWQFIDPEVALEAQRRLTVESHLRDVLREGRVIPWFMPVVSLADRRVRGYEALARWVGRDGTIMTPNGFLPVAETTGLIVDIDLAVTRGAIDLLTTLPELEHVAVNVSAPSLASTDYLRRYLGLLADSNVDPARLRLEITETTLLDANPDIADVMRQMAAFGSQWYVDDFGTGYSSISHLRDLPVGGLKLDMSFTAGIRNGDATCLKLAQGLIGLASGLGLQTVAEGIETEFEAGALLGQGWHQGQGWLFGKAAPIDLLPR